MTKSMLQIALLISILTTAALGFTTDVHAECSGARCVGLVDRLYTHSSANTIYVGTNGNEAALLCTPVEGVYLTLSPSQPLFAQIYASLLEAVTFSKTVNIRLPDSGSCRIIYVVLQRTSTSSSEAGEE